MAEIQVRGLKELNVFLQQLPVKIEANVLRGALRAGAKVIAAEAKRLVPVAAPTGKNRRLYGGYAGALRDSIRVGANLDKRAGKVVAYVRAGPSASKSKKMGAIPYYAVWVEYGTAAHWIKVREDVRPGRITRRGYRKASVRTLNRMAARGSLRIGENFVGASVKHPGSSPRPYMRPALDQKAQEAIVAAGEYMKKRLATKEGIERASEVEIETFA